MKMLLFRGENHPTCVKHLFMSGFHWEYLKTALIKIGLWNIISMEEGVILGILGRKWSLRRVEQERILKIIQADYSRDITIAGSDRLPNSFLILRSIALVPIFSHAIKLLRSIRNILFIINFFLGVLTHIDILGHYIFMWSFPLNHIAVESRLVVFCNFVYYTPSPFVVHFAELFW